MVRIRLRRVGRKNAPVYRIVVAEITSPRDGRFIEVIGQYAPREGKAGGTGRLDVSVERANHWLDRGAQPSDTVRSLLRRVGVLRTRHEARVASAKATSAVPVQE
jgi:small subunit ribosomal protein S16